MTCFQRSRVSHAKKCWTQKEIRQKGYDMAVYVAAASLWSSCMVITPTVHLSSEVSQDIVPSSLTSWTEEALSAWGGKLESNILHNCTIHISKHFPIGCHSTRQFLYIWEWKMLICHETKAFVTLAHLKISSINSVPFLHPFTTSLCFLLLIISSFSVQVRCLGTTTPPSSPAVRWWTLAATSSSSTSARRL